MSIAALPLETERLSLEPLRVDHAPEMASVLGDPLLHRFIGGAPLDPGALASRYERLARGASEDERERWLNWIVREKETGHAVGTVQATVTRAPEGERAVVAWIIGTPWQGRGFASEAARALVSWLAVEVALIEAHVSPDHLASEAVARRAGLRRTTRREAGEVVWCAAGGPHAPA